MNELIRYMYPIFLWSVEVIHSTSTFPLRTALGETVWYVVEPATTGRASVSVGRSAVVLMVLGLILCVPELQCPVGSCSCCTRHPEYRSGQHRQDSGCSSRTRLRRPPQR